VGNPARLCGGLSSRPRMGGLAAGSSWLLLDTLFIIMLAVLDDALAGSTVIANSQLQDCVQDGSVRFATSARNCLGAAAKPATPS
jgi:hypothetical protein